MATNTGLAALFDPSYQTGDPELDALFGLTGQPVEDLPPLRYPERGGIAGGEEPKAARGRGGRGAAPDTIQQAYSYMVERGLPPHVAAGLAGGFMQESGGVAGGKLNKEGGMGLGQWRKERLYGGNGYTGLIPFARSRGASIQDWRTQIDYALNELEGPERKAFERLLATKTPEEAALIASQFYERPAKEAANNQNRIKWANSLYSGQGVPQETYAPTQFSNVPEWGAQLNPAMVSPVQQLIDQYRAEGIDLRVQSGHRDIEEQRKLYAQGRTAPGKIVTWTAPEKSKHVHGDAVDLVPYVNGKPTWDMPEEFWQQLGQRGTALGLEWGGNWKKSPDRPHFQVSPQLVKNMGQSVTPDLIVSQTPQALRKTQQQQESPYYPVRLSDGQVFDVEKGMGLDEVATMLQQNNINAKPLRPYVTLDGQEFDVEYDMTDDEVQNMLKGQKPVAPEESNYLGAMKYGAQQAVSGIAQGAGTEIGELGKAVEGFSPTIGGYLQEKGPQLHAYGEQLGKDIEGTYERPKGLGFVEENITYPLAETVGGVAPYAGAFMVPGVGTALGTAAIHAGSMGELESRAEAQGKEFVPSEARPYAVLDDVANMIGLNATNKLLKAFGQDAILGSREAIKAAVEKGGIEEAKKVVGSRIGNIAKQFLGAETGTIGGEVVEDVIGRAYTDQPLIGEDAFNEYWETTKQMAPLGGVTGLGRGFTEHYNKATEFARLEEQAAVEEALQEQDAQRQKIEELATIGVTPEQLQKYGVRNELEGLSDEELLESFKADLAEKEAAKAARLAELPEELRDIPYREAKRYQQMLEEQEAGVPSEEAIEPVEEPVTPVEEPIAPVEEPVAPVDLSGVTPPPAPEISPEAVQAEPEVTEEIPEPTIRGKEPKLPEAVAPEVTNPADILGLNNRSGLRKQLQGFDINNVEDHPKIEGILQKTSATFSAENLANLENKMKEVQSANGIQIPAAPDVSSVAQPEIRQEGQGAPISSEGVRSSGQEIGAVKIPEVKAPEVTATAPIKEPLLYTWANGQYGVLDEEAIHRRALAKGAAPVNSGGAMDPQTEGALGKHFHQQAQKYFAPGGGYERGSRFRVATRRGVYLFKTLDEAKGFAEEYGMKKGTRRVLEEYTPPEAKVPESKVPEVETPEVEAPEVEAPEVEAPEVRAEKPETPEVPEIAKAPKAETLALTEQKAPPAKESKTPVPVAKPDALAERITAVQDTLREVTGLLKEEQAKPKPNPALVSQYKARQRKAEQVFGNLKKQQSQQLQVKDEQRRVEAEQRAEIARREAARKVIAQGGFEEDLIAAEKAAKKAEKERVAPLEPVKPIKQKLREVPTEEDVIKRIEAMQAKKKEVEQKAPELTLREQEIADAWDSLPIGVKQDLNLDADMGAENARQARAMPGAQAVKKIPIGLWGKVELAAIRQTNRQREKKPDVAEAPKVEAPTGETRIKKEKFDAIYNRYVRSDEKVEAGIGYIYPDAFLKATTSAAEEARIKQELEQYGPPDFNQRTPIELTIDERGNIVDHEGRHRMMVLRDKGYKQVPVIIKRRSSSDVPLQKSLYPQKTGGNYGREGAFVYGLKPIHYDKRAELEEQFAERTSKAEETKPEAPKVEEPKPEAPKEPAPAWEKPEAVKRRMGPPMPAWEKPETTVRRMGPPMPAWEKPTAKAGEKEVPEWIQLHEEKTGGKSVQRKGDIALIQGFSIVDGLPVFLGAKEYKRTKIDIESYTGNLFTPEEKADLIAAKKRWVEEDNKAYEANPDGPFKKGEKFAASENVPKEIQEIAKQWQNMLGLSERIYLTTIADVKKANYAGPFAAIPSQGLNANELGSKRRLANGDFVIAYRPSARTSKTLETISHEMGHALMDTRYQDTSPEIRKALDADYEKWLLKNEGATARELIDSLRAHTVGKQTDVAKGAMAANLDAYWRKKEEWFADQVSRWATTDKKPLGVVEEFFSKLAQAMKRFFLANRQYLATKNMSEWLSSLGEANVEPAKKEAGKIDTTIEQARAKAEGPSETELKEAEKRLKASGLVGAVKDKTFGDKFKGVINDLFKEGRNTSFVAEYVDIREPISKAVQDLPDNVGKKLRSDYIYSAYEQRGNVIQESYRKGFVAMGRDGTIETVADKQLALAEIFKRVGAKNHNLFNNVLVALRVRTIRAQDAETRAQANKLLNMADEMEDFASTLKNPAKRKKFNSAARNLRTVAERKLEGINWDKGRTAFTEQEVKDAETVLAGHPELVNEAENVYALLRKQVDLWENEGMIDKATADDWRKYPNYFPLYKTEKYDEQLANPSAHLDSYGAMMGKNPDKLPKVHRQEWHEHKVFVEDNLLRHITFFASAAAEHSARKNTAYNLEMVGKAERVKKDSWGDKDLIVKFRENGKDVFYRVDDIPSYYAMQSAMPLMSPLLKRMRQAGNFGRGVMIKNPLFWFRQSIREPIQASLVGRAGFISPFDTLNAVSRIASGSAKGYERLRAKGVIGPVDIIPDPAEFIKTVQNGKGLIDKGMDGINHVHEAMDAATRVVVYEKAKKDALSKGFDEETADAIGVMKAREIINFAKQGRSKTVRAIRATTPFFGAALNSLDVMARAAFPRKVGHLSKAEAMEARRNFYSTAFMLATFTTAYAAMMSEDEDYLKEPDRVGNWLIPIGGGKFIKIPIPFEAGWFIKELPELAMLLNLGAINKKEAITEGAKGAAANVLPPMPTAYVLQPVMEVAVDHDFFTGSSIEGKDSDVMVRDRNSKASKLMSEVVNKMEDMGVNVLGVSANQLEHLARKYLGQLWAVTRVASDAYINRGKVTPEKEAGEYPLVSGVLTTGTKDRAVNQFYTVAKEASQVNQSLEEAGKKGDAERFNQIVKNPENVKALKGSDEMKKLKEEIGEISTGIKRIENDQTLSSSEMTSRIKTLKARQTLLAKRGVEVARKLGMEI